MHNFLSTSRWYQCVSVRHLLIASDRIPPILHQICSYYVVHASPRGPRVTTPGRGSIKAVD